MRRLSYSLLLLGILVFGLSCTKNDQGAVGTGSVIAPSFTLVDLESRKVRLDDYRNKVVMVEFFATWCPPCQMSAPDVKSVYEKYRDKGFVVLAISLDKEPEAAAALKSFREEFSLTYPLLVDDGNTSREYGVISIPTSFIIDKQGKIRGRHIGVAPDFAAALSKEIEPLL